MALPEHVHRVTARGKVYHYFQAGRNTPKAGSRVRIKADPNTSAFWTEYEALAKLHGATVTPTSKLTPGSMSDLVMQFSGDEKNVGSPEWIAFAENTRANYRIYLDRMCVAWGALPAKDLRARHILNARDQMKDTPFAANSFLAVGMTLFRWGIPREFAESNPFRDIERFDTDEYGHIPWPRWAWEYCAKHANEDLARFIFVALHTGQREVDVLRMGPPDLDGAGLWVKPKKTRKRRPNFWVPLTSAVLAEFERMNREPVSYLNSRFKEPVRIATTNRYVFSPRGRDYTPDSFRSRWNRWLSTDEGKTLKAKWQDYCRFLAERAGEEFDPEEAKQPALHGLRGSAVALRRMAGSNQQQIANDIGMSIPMVSRYTRFMDQKAAAESNISLLELAEKRFEGVE